MQVSTPTYCDAADAGAAAGAGAGGVAFFSCCPATGFGRINSNNKIAGEAHARSCFHVFFVFTAKPLVFATGTAMLDAGPP
jgi:hypothetical protein